MSEEIRAGAELVRDFDSFMPVKAAFWLRISDDELRYLYIASDKIDGTTIARGYGEILRLANKMNSPYLNPFRVKLIGTDKPLARAALEFHGRYPDNRPTWLGGEWFGGKAIEDGYLYPPALSMVQP